MVSKAGEVVELLGSIFNDQYGYLLFQIYFCVVMGVVVITWLYLWLGLFYIVMRGIYEIYYNKDL
jgi:hypothetical protein